VRWLETAVILAAKLTSRCLDRLIYFFLSLSYYTMITFPWYNPKLFWNETSGQMQQDFVYKTKFANKLFSGVKPAPPFRRFQLALQQSVLALSIVLPLAIMAFTWAVGAKPEKQSWYSFFRSADGLLAAMKGTPAAMKGTSAKTRVAPGTLEGRKFEGFEVAGLIAKACLHVSHISQEEQDTATQMLVGDGYQLEADLRKELAYVRWGEELAGFPPRVRRALLWYFDQPQAQEGTGAVGAAGGPNGSLIDLNGSPR
jgi:hypothetical protein